MKNLILSVLAVANLAACGAGTGTSSIDTSQKNQSKQQSIKQAASSYQNVVEALYISYFGRPADPNGLVNFEAALQAADAPSDVAGLASAYSTNPDVRGLVDSFGTSKESVTLYGTGDTQAFVTAVFQNVLGRAPQQAGLSYWAGAIDGGTLSKGDAALAIMAGALANGSTQGLQDQQLINNRLVVANYFTAQISLQNEVAAYSGAGPASTARTMLGNVTGTTSVSTFESENVATALAQIAASVPSLKLIAGNVEYQGSSGGPGLGSFNRPSGIAVDANGTVYVGDTYNYLIRKVTPAGVVSTLAGSTSGNADGTGAAASFGGVFDACNSIASPIYVTAGADGNVYVADNANNEVRKVTPAGVVTTIAGHKPGECGAVVQDGTGLAASFGNLSGIAADQQGNIYVVDSFYLRKITPAGVVTTIGADPSVYTSGDAFICSGSKVILELGGGITLDKAGNIFVTGFGAICKINPQGDASVFATYKNGSGSVYDSPGSIAADSAGNLYVNSTGDNTILKITSAGAVSVLAGNPGVSGYADGTESAATFDYPLGVATDSDGNVYVTDAMNNTVRKISPAGAVTTLAGTAPYYLAEKSNPSGDGTGMNAYFGVTTGITNDSSGNLYVADFGFGAIRKLTPSGIVTTVAYSRYGDGPSGGSAPLIPSFSPLGIVSDSAGNFYVTELYTPVILKITAVGTVSTLAGNSQNYGNTNGTGSSATFNGPSNIAINAAGNIFVTDPYNSNVRMITPAGLTSTVVGAEAGLSFPVGLAFDNAGNLYVTDSAASVIWKISTGGQTSVFAGTPGVKGSADGAGSVATFNGVGAIVCDPNGNLYVVDSENYRVRKITPQGVVSTIAVTVGQTQLPDGVLPAMGFVPNGLAIQGNALYITSGTGVFVVNNLF